MPMTLSEFITTETERLLGFAKLWREHNLKDPPKFPLELSGELPWCKQFLAYSARDIEEKHSSKT